MNASISDDAVIDRFTDALVAGDVEAARACCTDDVVIWHNFDGVAQDFETAAKGWQGLFTHFSDRAFTDIRRATIPGGFMQQHLMAATSSAGDRIGWAIAIVVALRDGKIARFEEYMDRAGKLALAPGQTNVPGLAPAD